MLNDTDMLSDIKEVLVTEQEIRETVQKLGEKISEDYKGKNLLLVSVLKGAVVFMADLMRAITIPCQIDFLSVSSYGNGIKSTGVIKIEKDLNKPIEGYDVLIVEDILDSGRSLNYTIDMLSIRNPKSIEICSLFDKPSRRQVEVNAKYIGITVPDEFIVGYGLDYAEKYRNLPFIGILNPEIYENK